jgi:hypothetical protein
MIASAFVMDLKNQKNTARKATPRKPELGRDGKSGFESRSSMNQLSRQQETSRDAKREEECAIF